MKVESFHNWELERALRESGMDQRELAEKCGVDSSAISHIKRGRMRPTDEEEKAIAAALNMPISKLFVKSDSV